MTYRVSYGELLSSSGMVIPILPEVSLRSNITWSFPNNLIYLSY
jgi:hypothetical protein